MTDAGVFVVMLGAAIALLAAPARHSGFRIMSAVMFFAVSLVLFSGGTITSTQVITGINATETVTTRLLVHGDSSQLTLGYLFFFVGLVTALSHFEESLKYVAGFVSERRRRAADGA